ncbi:GNAT family N-acetyltransferase [Oxalobacteraceae bacterium OTU3CINTB1]|nr:GNAT family N-acetyltransferase [Oxalobacteraceae bacterium OTU3CINTB1]
MSAITLRPATPQDAEFMLRLYRGTRQDLAALADEVLRERIVAMQFAAQQQQYLARFPHAEVSVVVDGDRPVGRLYVDCDETGVRLVDISLLPEVRNRGIGAGLLRALMTRAGAHALPLRLSVLPTNRARSLYARLGFEAAGDGGLYQSMEWRAAGAPAAT